MGAAPLSPIRTAASAALGILTLLAFAANADDAMPPGMYDRAFLDPAAVITLDQGWDAEDRAWFHHADQGSRLLPYDLFLALEQPGSEALFRAPEFLQTFGAIASPVSGDNPDGLPIGFVKSRWRGQTALGLTCAACHTQPMTYEGRAIRIDGGQAVFDLQRMHGALVQALAQTLANDGRLRRTAKRLGVSESEARLRIETTHAERARFEARNHSAVPYGYTRLDAFGAIMNKALLIADPTNEANPADAPISYPYLWDTPHHDYVEWNGLSQNSLAGALARNIGEVVGVFGELEPETEHWLFYDAGYDSSIRGGQLRRIEKHITGLLSPKWPDFFPPVDAELAAEGDVLFDEYCGECHLPIDRTDPARHIEARMSTLEAVGTDPKMATNALTHAGRSGRFEGKPRYYSLGAPMAAEVPALHVVNHLMVGVLRNHPIAAKRAEWDAKALGQLPMPKPPKWLDGKRIDDGTQGDPYTLSAYKSRPLNGIWATPPYLHNGSVKSLYELMLPAAMRSETFFLSTLEFDPKDVGYVDEPAMGAYLFDTRRPGNSNAGHEYGTGTDGKPVLDERERRAIVEYMKTL